MMREIVFPKTRNTLQERFESDARKFILVLFAIAFFGFVICVQFFWLEGLGAKEVMFKSLDLFTILIPPSLPAALMIGTIFAVQRLGKVNISVL
jgi:cation-transporting ATPase 13A3/4/5